MHVCPLLTFRYLNKMYQSLYEEVDRSIIYGIHFLVNLENAIIYTKFLQNSSYYHTIQSKRGLSNDFKMLGQPQMIIAWVDPFLF